jgi:hypothetical protein
MSIMSSFAVPPSGRTMPFDFVPQGYVHAFLSKISTNRQKASKKTTKIAATD